MKLAAIFRTLHQRIVPYIAFILLTVLILDNYVFPKTESIEKVDNGTIDITRGRKSKHHYYLLTKEGGKYRVTETLFHRILIDQQIGVYKTILFKRTVKITWCEQDRSCYIQNIGAFIPGAFEFIFLGGLCLVSLLSASGIARFHWINNYVLFFLSGGALAYYLVY